MHRQQRTTWSIPGLLLEVAPDRENVHLVVASASEVFLEPPQAAPVIIGQPTTFIGSRRIIVEGVRVGSEAVLGAKCGPDTIHISSMLPVKLPIFKDPNST